MKKRTYRTDLRLLKKLRRDNPNKVAFVLGRIFKKKVRP